MEARKLFRRRGIEARAPRYSFLVFNLPLFLEYGGPPPPPPYFVIAGVFQFTLILENEEKVFRCCWQRAPPAFDLI